MKVPPADWMKHDLEGASRQEPLFLRAFGQWQLQMLASTGCLAFPLYFTTLRSIHRKLKFPEYHQTGPPPGRIDQSQTPKFCCLLCKLALRRVTVSICLSCGFNGLGDWDSPLDGYRHARTEFTVCSMIHGVVLTQPCFNIPRLLLCLQLDLV